MPPQVNGGDVAFQLTGRGQRSELEPALPAVHEADQHDVTFSVRLDGEFATSSEARQVIARWENDSPGQAPLDLRVNEGELLLHGGEGHPSGPQTFTRTLGRAPIGTWTQLRVLVRFSADPHKAGVSVWRDGRSVIDDDHPPGGTLYPGQQSYLKVGLHRDRSTASPSTVRFSAWRIDHGRAPADPDRAGPSRDHTPAVVRPSTGPAHREGRSTRPGTSDRPASERSDRDVTRHIPTIQQDTSPHDGSDREESGNGSTTSERSSTGSEHVHRSSQPDTSHRRAFERSSWDGSNHDAAQCAPMIHRGTSSDNRSHHEEQNTSTSEHRPEPGRRTPPRDTSPRVASEDIGAFSGSSRHGASRL